MNEQLQVTVVIPNYNNERYIERCINSILRQSYKSACVIVVDDCSTDNSREIIKNLEEKYLNIKCIYLEKNAGVSNARNIGLNNVQTEYVTYIDGDDFYYNPYKLENEMALIKKYSDYGIDIVAYSPIVISDEKGHISREPSLRRGKFVSGNAKLDFISRNKSNTIPRDYCVKKNILMKVGAYSFYKNFYEDLDLLLRLAFDVEFYCTYEFGTAYRQTTDGLSKRKQEEHMAAIKEICDAYYVRLNNKEKIIVKYKKVKWYVFFMLNSLKARIAKLVRR